MAPCPQILMRTSSGMLMRYANVSWFQVWSWLLWHLTISKRKQFLKICAKIRLGEGSQTMEIRRPDLRFSFSDPSSTSLSNHFDRTE